MSDLVHRLRLIVAEPAAWCKTDVEYVEDAADEIERLTAERDEARRMYCGRVSRDVPLDAFDIAKNHGWDCFPQEDESCQ
jgi:hypothetical protein